MKQTAVEQFEAHLIEYGFDLSLHKFEIQTFKEMEKEQIMDAHYEGSQNYRRQFYVETFKSE